MTDSVNQNRIGISVQGLEKCFGHTVVLKDLNLEVKRGEFLTIFGPNGAGKTTLIKILSTVIPPSSGEIRIAGVNLREGGQELRRKIGVISHSTYLYENLTAYENIKFYGKMYDVPDVERRALEVITEVGLKNRMHDLVSTYSRGMQQRLSLARAIIHHPSVLLLDEPDSGLDQHASLILSGLLQSLQAEDRTIIMTTHNLTSGLALCDRAAILAGGRIVYQEEMGALDAATFDRTYFQYVGEAGDIG